MTFYKLKPGIDLTAQTQLTSGKFANMRFDVKSLEKQKSLYL